jgi:lantibiotic modifying enzyme
MIAPELNDIAQHFKLLERHFLGVYREQVKSDGLLAGRAGIIILQFLISRHTQDKNALEKEIQENMDLLIENIENNNSGLATYCDGLAGIAWMFCFLHEKHVIELEIDELLSSIDQLIEKGLDHYLEKVDFDTFHGVIGIGLYFLKRNKSSHVEKIILKLQDSGVPIADGIAWKQIDRGLMTGDAFNLSLSHGITGILYFLGKCSKKEILTEITGRMMKKTVNFILAHSQSTDSAKSAFPFSIPFETKDFAQIEFPQRQAWCVGDLGIIHTLMLVAEWTEDRSLHFRCRELLDNLQLTKPELDTTVADACFCHGSAGVGYMLLKFFRITGNEQYRDAALYWAKYTIKFNKRAEGSVLGNTALVYGKPKQTSDLLNGLGGLWLSLYALLNENEDHSWDEIFFLS